MSKFFAITGLIGGLFALLSAFAHAFAGWPAMAAPLDQAQVAPDIEGALMVGWCWGSFTLAGTGLVVLGQAWNALRGQRVDRITVGFVSMTYIAFGIWAMLMRDLNPHFLGFVLIGLFSAALLKPTPP